MSHLNATRKGWQNEHLGLFILSKFAFCANPVTVSDDLGSDFFCCLFETRTEKGIEVALPLNSFAIQLKSSPKPFDVSNKIEYLSRLEIPFFVGVVKRLKLSIYSGEYLPLFFSEKGNPRKLHMQLVNRGRLSLSQRYSEFAPGKFRLRCPRVVTVRASTSKVEIKKVVRNLNELCARIHGNIATRRTDEHVYAIPGKAAYLIMAGPGSAKVFRRNFYWRLAEVFYNFVWLIERQPKRFDPHEAEIYIGLFKTLRIYGAEMPRVTVKRYRQLVALMRSWNRSQRK